MGWLSNLFGGGGSNKTTTTTNSAPWSAAQPALKLGLDEATKLFKQNPDGSYYKGNTVIDWSNRTKQGMGNIQALANANMGGKGLSGQYQNIINQGGMTDPMKNAANVYNYIAGGSGLAPTQERALGYATNIAKAGGFNGATSQALEGFKNTARNPFNSYQTAALQNTRDLANSSFDTNANPAFQQVLRQAQDAARDSVNMSAGASGRYGGGVHQGNLASEVGDLTSRMVGDEYRNWQGRKDAANQNLFSMGQTGIANQMGANTSIGNLGNSALSQQMNAMNMMNTTGQQALANRAGAAGGLASLGQAAIGNLGTAYSGMKNPAQDLMQVGGMEEDLATRQMNEKLRLWNDKFNAPWEQIGRLNAIASGAGQMGGTQTTAQPGQNPFLNALGYGATGLGLLGGLFG